MVVFTDRSHDVILAWGIVKGCHQICTQLGDIRLKIAELLERGDAGAKSVNDDTQSKLSRCLREVMRGLRVREHVGFGYLQRHSPGELWLSLH